MSVYVPPGAGSTGAPLPPSRIKRGEGVLGVFSKGCQGSYQLSLAPSGGEYCDVAGCRQSIVNGGTCYGGHTERLKSRLIMAKTW